MSAPTKECRPCPKCGNRIARDSVYPARCGYCGTKLRARVSWTPGCDCGWEDQRWFATYEKARDAVVGVHSHIDEKERAVCIPVFGVQCDCGYEYGRGSVTDCRFYLSAHKQMEHTP